MRHIQELTYSLNPSSVLDVGCGDGRFIGALGREIDRRVGIDLSERAIRFAKAFIPNVNFRAIDAGELHETFDLVVAIEVLEHIPDERTDEFLKTLAERTNIGGHVIISVPTTIVPLNKRDYRHYDLELLQKQMASSGARLKIIRVDYVYRLSLPMEFYARLFQNRLLTIEVRCLQRVMWNYVWNTLRRASEKNRKHLVVTLLKPPESRTKHA